MVKTHKHADVIAAIEERCPRCGAPRDMSQEYCVECGKRLPILRGTVPALRRSWIRRFGWYPGDWVWMSIPTLAVAIAGAAVAIAVGGSSSSVAATTEVAPPPQTVPTTTAAATVPTQTAPATTTKPVTTTATPANGRTPWPAGRNGWTTVLFSYPVTGGTAGPYATAARAAAAGLPEVGVIDSGQYSSLHPGYYVVFSGIYSSYDEAAAALHTVQASGFGSAYAREITR